MADRCLFQRWQSRCFIKTGFCLAFLCLCACGPREIGENSSLEAATPPDVSGYEMLRLPMSGANATQKFLYWANRPDVMQNVQNMRREKYLRALGLKPNPEDPAYREIPKQRSPFRQ